MAGPRKPRRPRGGLSEDDRAVWAQVAATAEPLVHRPARPVEQAPPVHRAPRDNTPAPVGRPLPDRSRPAKPSVPRIDLAPRPGPVGAPEAGLDKRTADRLRRGRRVPEARIDLHGMTSMRAHAKCLQFLSDAVSRGLRLVLVITGKGADQDHQPFHAPSRGVLRAQLPGWIAASPLAGHVVGIYQAHQRHGGAGAYYIYLKRRR